MTPPKYQIIHEMALEIVQAVRSTILSSSQSFCGVTFLSRDLADKEMEIVAELVRLQLSCAEESVLLVTQDRCRLSVDLVEPPTENREQILNQTSSELRIEYDEDLSARQ